MTFGFAGSSLVLLPRCRDATFCGGRLLFGAMWAIWRFDCGLFDLNCAYISSNSELMCNDSFSAICNLALRPSTDPSFDEPWSALDVG